MDKKCHERTVEQVWNKQNYKLTSTFEYENEDAYRACEKIIDEKVMPKALANSTVKAKIIRAIIIYGYRSQIIFL